MKRTPLKRNTELKRTGFKHRDPETRDEKKARRTRKRKRIAAMSVKQQGECQILG